MRRKRTKRQKEKWSLIGGIAGLVLGFWMLFIIKTQLGFIPAIMGSILLVFGRR